MTHHDPRDEEDDSEEAKFNELFFEFWRFAAIIFIAIMAIAFLVAMVWPADAMANRLRLSPGVVVVLTEPVGNNCQSPGWDVRLPGGGKTHWLRMTAIPSAGGIEATPTGRIHCGGFE